MEISKFDEYILESKKQFDKDSKSTDDTNESRKVKRSKRSNEPLQFKTLDQLTTDDLLDVLITQRQISQEYIKAIKDIIIQRTL